MRLKYFLSIGILGWFLFFLSSHKAFAISPSVVITQFQISGVTADDEFIRLKNETSADINLSGFRLSKKTLSGGICKESSLVSTAHFQGLLPADGTFLITHPTYKDSYGAPLDYSSASYYLSGNTVLLLYDQSGTLLDRKVSGTACDAPLPEPEPTPPATDPVPIPPIPDPLPPPTPPSIPIAVRFNEILPDPSAKGDAGEFIELSNFGTEPTDISGWEILDASAIKKKSDGKALSKSDRLVFPNATFIHPGEYLLVTDADPWFSLTLNNTNETLSLFDKNGISVDSFHFDTSKKDISLNYTPTGWRSGTPTPGTANSLNSLPETREKVPKKGYRDVSLAFDARGRDTDDGNLKYVWDFGDGHKSYREKTSHTYEKNGTYQVTLTTTDGSDDVTETFTLKIETLPRPNVRITKMIPNPSGKDTEGEWIMIENRGKKSIDLKNFGIATGWKKLTNHPIRENFIIKPKETAKLTREFSLFTLPNQKGKIELRAPDGKVLQKIKYKLSEAAEEGAVYNKEKGRRWEWQESEETEIAEPPLTKTAPEDIIAPSVAPIITPEEMPEDTLQEVTPEENSVAPSKDQEITGEKQVLGAETTITETSSDHTPSKTPLDTGEHPFVIFFRNFFMNLNVRLNDWQNEQSLFDT